MDSGAIEIRGEGHDIALRNEEINRKRMERRDHTGPLKVTDPAAFARLMADMKQKAEEQRLAEAQREAERARREGANYKSKEEREREAREAKQQPRGEDEAKQVERRFDPGKNYYELMGVDRCASTAEIKRAYKKLALSYHPDKHKTEDPEQQAAIADKFKQVVEAFDVLTDEAQRGVYDKIRDYKETNPGRGLPVLSPEELAMMSSGAAELRRLRRMGTKVAKHRPLEKEVWVSLKKLNGGGMKRVAVVRQRVDPDGSLIQHSRTYHLVIRKGMQEGDRLTFEEEGEEAVDTHPGDLFFVLRQKPHPLFKRSGRSNLEVFAGALSPGDLLFGVDLTTLQGRRCLLRGSAWAASTAAGCGGGLWQSVVTGQGLYDPQDPWDKPPGDLVVQVRYPGFKLGPGCVSTCLKPRPLYLLGSATARVPAALVGGFLAASLNHRLLAEELRDEGWLSPAAEGGSKGSRTGSEDGGGRGGGRREGARSGEGGRVAAGGGKCAGEAAGEEDGVARSEGRTEPHFASVEGAGTGSPHPGSNAASRSPLAVCITFHPQLEAVCGLDGGVLRSRAAVHGCCAGEGLAGDGRGALPALSLSPSPAAATLMSVLQRRVAGLQGRVLPLPIQLCPACTAGLSSAAGQRGAAAPAVVPVAGSTACTCTGGLLDDEWCALHAADVIILDGAPPPAIVAAADSPSHARPAPPLSDSQGGGAGAHLAGGSSNGGTPVHSMQSSTQGNVQLLQQPEGGCGRQRGDGDLGGDEVAEALLCWAQRSAQGAGLMQALVGAFWRGAALVGVGGGCALLGRLPRQRVELSGHSVASKQDVPPAVLPWDVLVATACWAAAQAASHTEPGEVVHEGDEDYGFFYAARLS